MPALVISFQRFLKCKVCSRPVRTKNINHIHFYTTFSCLSVGFGTVYFLFYDATRQLMAIDWAVLKSTLIPKTNSNTHFKFTTFIQTLEKGFVTMLQQFQITYLQCTPKTHLISLSFIIKALYYTITAHNTSLALLKTMKQMETYVPPKYRGQLLSKYELHIAGKKIKFFFSYKNGRS